jgi:UDP-4-amino-4,6-dideoxy-N-acetyl-beta-L-altrosamine transaminase
MQHKYNIPYGKQYISEEDIKAVAEVLRSDFLTQGPKIAEFEKRFAEYVGSKYAVAVSNGTTALHLAAIVLGVNEHSKVITTPITFVASANCVLYCGGKVDFADIDERTGLLDIKKVEERLKQFPKGTYAGIVVVDYAGAAVNLEAYWKLADEYGLWIIEDACHAPGGYFIDSNNRKQYCGNGNFADISVFSFHPVKHIACGEGGMLTTNNKELYERLMILRTHGITKDAEKLQHQNQGGWYYEMQELGNNYRLTDMQAALGISQLATADERLAKRKEIAAVYDAFFKNIAEITIDKDRDDGHAFHLYIIRCKERRELYNYLKEHGIHAQVHYIPVHLQPYYQKLGWEKGDFPVAEAFYDTCLSLPMYPTLSDEEQEYVMDTIQAFYK